MDKGAQRKDAALALLQVQSAWETHAKMIIQSDEKSNRCMKGATGAPGKVLPGMQDKAKQRK